VYGLSFEMAKPSVGGKAFVELFTVTKGVAQIEDGANQKEDAEPKLTNNREDVQHLSLFPILG